MRKLILKQIENIEKKFGVKVLYACESGSRAWGFPSPNSDYDVRFIYSRSAKYYLSLFESKDTIEIPINDELDINGWDLRKALKLFIKSNGPLYEWFQSPIIYKSNPEFEQEIKLLLPTYYSLIAGFHHYFSMAKNVLENDLQGNLVKLKKYFYAIRPLLSCQWIIDNKSIPPMEFGALRTLITDQTWNSLVDDLLSKKKIENETAVIPSINDLQHWISRTMAYCDKHSREILPPRFDAKELNELFLKYIS